jgi:hypothetical protein
MLAAASVVITLGIGALAIVTDAPRPSTPADLLAQWIEAERVPTNGELLFTFQGTDDDGYFQTGRPAPGWCGAGNRFRIRCRCRRGPALPSTGTRCSTESSRHDSMAGSRNFTSVSTLRPNSVRSRSLLLHAERH